MLPRAHRLTRSAEITRVFQRGQTYAGVGFLVKHLPRECDGARVAVVVGVKLAKRANVRNRIKRRLREVLRLNLAALPAAGDLLIVARTPKLAVTDFSDLTTQVLKTLKQISSNAKVS